MERQNIIKDFVKEINNDDTIGILYKSGERCIVGAVGESYTLFRLTSVGLFAGPKSYSSKRSLLENIAQEESDFIADIVTFYNYRQMYKWALRKDSTFHILIRNILGAR
jgi:hypothetical protein